MTDPDAERDAEAARFLRRVRWMMAAAGATTLIAIAAVLVVIGYRVSRMEGSGPAIAEATALLPKDARVIATAIADDRIVVTVEIAGAVEVRMYDMRTLKPVGRLQFANEP